MSFRDKFNDAEENFNVEIIIDGSEPELNEKFKDYTTASEHLRSLGYRLKMETRTQFGTQIDLSKKYPERDLKRDLKGYNFEIDGDKIFIKR